MAVLRVPLTLIALEGVDGGRAFSPMDDGWLDASAFMEEEYGFLPIVVPITEPAVGYGAAAGLSFVSSPLVGRDDGYGRPNITFVGGMLTESSSWGTFGGDLRHWMDDRVQTMVGVMHASLNLDYYGVGENPGLGGESLPYNLTTTGGMAQAKLRLGKSRVWLGLSYALGRTEVEFEAPSAELPIQGEYQDYAVATLSPSLTFDSRDNIFTTNRGTYIEGSVGLSSEALGGDAEFQRPRLVVMHYLPLAQKLFFGVRTDMATSHGDVPFFLRPYVSLRGVPALRYQGEAMAQVEAELRWQFWQRLSAVGFGGVGAAWNDNFDFEEAQALPTCGFGLRYELARKYGIHAGMDVAFSEENAAIYVQFGGAWARP